ncbi:MAG TPA: GNAT family N-acetyltransferase [Solirubrobacteraceae bacterium]|nr:GNAT family N-acetyltransferase [Solirubrobacteraceae bacterium]
MCFIEGDVPVLTTARLRLEPLTGAHADELAPLLADRRVYRFTGGEPPTLRELRDRYRRQETRRSPDGLERWLNWALRRRADGRAVGFVQSTVSEDPPAPAPVTAVLAWVIGPEFQGAGYAREAAGQMVAWLEDAGVRRFVAYIHPRHAASMGVAAGLGMTATDERVDGEVVWERWSVTPDAAGHDGGDV